MAVKSCNHDSRKETMSTEKNYRIIYGAFLLFSLIINSGPAYSGYGSTGGGGKEKIGDQETTKTPAISQKVYEKLTEAQKLIEEKQFTAGLAVMGELRATESKLTNYERAQMWNVYAYTYYLQEKYNDSINSYEKLVAIPDIPEGLVTSSINTLAQLYFTVENYKKALESANRLINMVDEPSDTIYLLIAQSYYQLNQFKEAIKPMETVINNAKSRGEKPKENWLLLLRVIYYELKDYKKMIAILHELLSLYPKEQYLRTLGAIHSEMGNTKKQLAVMEALYEKGYVTDERDIINLANLYLLHEVPYKAAKIMEQGMNKKIINQNVKNLRLLSQAWYQAREDKKSITPLKRAADISGDGELYVRLGQSYMNLDQWENAAEALKTALAKGGLKRTDTANIMLGVSLFNQKRYENARDAFRTASRSKDKRSQNEAVNWIAFIDSELERAKLMQEKAMQHGIEEQIEEQIN